MNSFVGLGNKGMLLHVHNGIWLIQQLKTAHSNSKVLYLVEAKWHEIYSPFDHVSLLINIKASMCKKFNITPNRNQQNEGIVDHC